MLKFSREALVTRFLSEGFDGFTIRMNHQSWGNTFWRQPIITLIKYCVGDTCARALWPLWLPPGWNADSIIPHVENLTPLPVPHFWGPVVCTTYSQSATVVLFLSVCSRFIYYKYNAHYMQPWMYRRGARQWCFNDLGGLRENSHWSFQWRLRWLN